MDYVGSLYGQKRPIRARLCSYQGSLQAMCQSPLLVRILLQCELCAVSRHRPYRSACQPTDDYRNGVQRVRYEEFEDTKGVIRIRKSKRKNVVAVCNAIEVTL